MDIRIQRIAESLRDSRRSIDRLEAANVPGVYAIFASAVGSVGAFPVGECGLIYVGVSGDLEAREFEQHFDSDGTGFSTVRRSLGAILKNELDLTAIPRSPGSKPSSYRFNDESELRLTAWMRDNLEVGVCGTADALAIETGLIVLLKPVLNLTKWPNPARKEIKRLRRICACEAQGM